MYPVPLPNSREEKEGMSKIIILLKKSKNIIWAIEYVK
jgi:hypothetical protein